MTGMMNSLLHSFYNHIIPGEPANRKGDNVELELTSIGEKIFETSEIL